MLKVIPILLTVALSPIFAAGPPDADKIIEQARIAATLQNNDLDGWLRKEGRKTQVGLFLRGKDIQFQYLVEGQPWSIFHMRLGNQKFDLFEMVNGKQVAFPAAKLVMPIAGTDLTYEDLSMRFFYWPNAKLEGQERVGTQMCWKLRLNNPGKAGNYRVVYVWVHQKFGAFMKIEGFDSKGNLMRRFEVDKTMKLADGSHTLKQMSVSSFAGGRKTGISNLEFDKPKGGPRGAR